MAASIQGRPLSVAHPAPAPLGLTGDPPSSPGPLSPLHPCPSLPFPASWHA